MFERGEALDFIKTFLGVDNAESRTQANKKELLDEILFAIQAKIPFQNINLLSMRPDDRRKPTPDEMKTNYTSGIGGLCFDLNICTFHLLSALGFEVTMVHCTVSTWITFPRDHVLLLARDVTQEGDKYLLDIACGHPTFSAISLDFEHESPVYTDSYLEYKFIKHHDGKLLRMHRKGDPLTARGVQANSEVEFWVDGWRRFYSVELDTETHDPSQFDAHHKEVYQNAVATPFHVSHRLVIFPRGKATMVINDKTCMDIDGELVKRKLEGGDEAIKQAIKTICPRIPQELLPDSLRHWRLTKVDRELMQPF